MDCGSTILIFLAFIQATCGQPVTLTGPPDGAIEEGSDTVYTCTGGTDPYTFVWNEIIEGTALNIFLAGQAAYDPLSSPKYLNFGVSENEGTSTMTISNTVIEDEGQYSCVELPAGTGKDADVELTVEVKGTWSLSAESTIESSIDMYEATCEALGGRPNETITWMLGGASPCDDPVETSVTADSGLFDKRSVCTFQATNDNNNGETLTCVISGHLVSELNGVVTTTLDTHSAPSAGILTVGFQSPDPRLTVSCVINDEDQPKPSMRNYYIYSNDSLIHQSSMGDKDVEVPDTEFNLYTEFTCIAGNYLGNVTSDPTRYDPDRPTTPSPTTGPAGLSAGAYAGIAIGVIACIVIIVVIVLYLLKPECCPCFGGSGFSFQALFSSCKCSLPTKSSASSNKPSGRAVGSSNGSEKNDVESPLNNVKDVTAEEKTRPQAAPRGHGSIQHTNDNPNQDMYAMVDKKKPGGDAPDRGSGPGQNEPQGMLYADLDLSHQAGHTEKHVPKNENDVVVYSSILV